MPWAIAQASAARNISQPAFLFAGRLAPEKGIATLAAAYQGYADAMAAEGVSPWKRLFEAAENGGGIEYYLVEQEGSRFSEIETAKKCLQSFREIHGA